MAKLSVALDARTLQGHPLGGVGRSTRAVVAAIRDEVDLLLLTDARRPRVDTDVPQQALRAPVSSTMAAWLQLALPPALRRFPGIFHCPWYGLPFWQPVPMVVTIHDLTFEHSLTGLRRGQRLAFRVQARWAARTAAHVLTVSEAVRRELCDRYRVDPARVSVQPNPLDPDVLHVDPGRESALRTRLGVNGRYVVALGGAARRRIDLAVAAWPRVRSRVPDVNLVVMGGQPAHSAPGIIVVGTVDDSEWATLLAGASALLYPTEFEGFGYPAKEAMALGTPVVCAPVGSMPEVVGEAGCWFQRHEPRAVADATVQLLTDAALADRLAAKGRELSVDATKLDALRQRVMMAYERSARSRR